MTTEDILLTLKLPIIVIGNATFHRKYGNVVDLFPTVIRINNYKIEGFEDLVGTKTTYRCTSGCADIESRGNTPEFSPFTEDSEESWNLENYKSLIVAKTDIHKFTHLQRPSTGFSMILLFDYLNIPISIIGFDGFQTPNLGESCIVSTHSTQEYSIIKQLHNIIFLE